MSLNLPEPDLESYLPRFRLTAFRPGQRAVISAVLAGEDCLCVMPTGGGKSLCYQLPAMVHEGLTLVVSPLIALMKDQVDQLHSLGLPATFINSTLSVAEQYARLEKMAAGQYRLVYVVPERFRSSRFLEAVRSVGLKLLAVDEAHCISEWGHDFRPDYSRLGVFRRRFGDPTTIALTATATDSVRRDIIEQLNLRRPRTFITGFARPNLFHQVLFPGTERQKAEMLLSFLRQTPGSGIVYASTRKKTEEVAAMIADELRRSTVAYHAGLLPDQRRTAQEAFMNGRTEIVAATTAFGMGIDKANVRFVVHYTLPGSLEAYYQEAGRAGRDGKPSQCLLLYNHADRWIQEYFIESAYPARDLVARVYDCLRSLHHDPIELTQQEIKEWLSLPIGAEGVGTCEQLLESAGVLERLVASQNRAAVRLDSELPTLVDLLPKQAKVKRRVLQAVERLVGPRRHEMVHFRPRELLDNSQLDHASLTDALRELNSLEAFTYVPPFRGRAIRMVRRDQPFEELDIDFDTLERRKAAEYEKLNQVAYFANSSHCRQQQILRYFGDESDTACDNCDNCRQSRLGADETQHPAPAVDDKLREVVRVVLSGVARAEREVPVSCGKILIAQMLCGSASARMSKLGLNRLSTFGLLADLTQQEVVTLIDGLIAAGHLEQVEFEPHRPVVQLTPLGTDVMKGNTDLKAPPPIPAHLIARIRGQGSPAATSKAMEAAGAVEPVDEPTEIPPVDRDLLAALKRWREETASRVKLPPHYVLTNATLEELARWRPASSQALLEVKGIGPVKSERYGNALLALLSRPSPEASEAEPETESSAEWSGPEPAMPQRPSEEPPPDLPSHEDSFDATPPQLEPPRGPIPCPDTADAKPASPPNSVDEADRPDADTTCLDAGKVRPSHYWTWRLLSAGFSAEECEAIRGISREAILDHILRAVEDGCPVRVEWCLSAGLLRALDAVVGPEQPAEIRPLLARLPPGTRYAEVQLYLMCRPEASGG